MNGRQLDLYNYIQTYNYLTQGDDTNIRLPITDLDIGLAIHFDATVWEGYPERRQRITAVPEILYHNATWCFLGIRGAENIEWIRIYGELSNRLLRTNISTWPNVSRTQNMLYKDLHLYKFRHGAIWEKSFRSCLLPVGLVNTRVVRLNNASKQTIGTSLVWFLQFYYFTKGYVE